jgi:cobalt/nickel transport protein
MRSSDPWSSPENCNGRYIFQEWQACLVRFCIQFLVVAVFMLGSTSVCQAHFGMILPDKSMVMPGDNPNLELTLAFLHPFEQLGMDMAKPRAFGVKSGKDKTDLLSTLQETKVLEKQAWKTTYEVKKPGVYTFYVDPEPYWEPAENKFIIHQTKTYVAAFGEEENWDQEVGLKAEIIPLTRPFGLYVHNVFQGLVKFKGKPASNAEVEVEYWNPDQETPPNKYFVTQVLKTDKNGVFTIAVPKAGWWGFAALKEEKNAMSREGKKVDAEYGAVLWVQFTHWQKPKESGN